MNTINKIFEENDSPKAFAQAYLNYLKQVLDRIDANEIAAFINALLWARSNDSTIYFIGNGGSASTANHFANDIGVGTRSWDKPFRVRSLCNNAAVITAVANDYGYTEIFLQQLKINLKKNDVVVAISASGNSENLLKAINYANQVGAVTIGLTAFDGGELRKIARLGVHVPTQKGEYGPAEDAHMVLDHLVGAYLGQCVLAEAKVA